MKRVLMGFILVAGMGLADIPWQWGFPKPADPTGVASDESAFVDVDMRTQGAGVLAVEAEVDSRGLTFDVSQDIVLNTKRVISTILILK